jgi:dihydroxynaphthoic acid synthetase
MIFEDILYEKNEGVARITFNRPKVYNAVRPQTIEELLHACEDADADATIGVVVISGTGGKAFSSGGDINEFGNSNPRKAWQIARTCMMLTETIRGMGKVVIAAIDGYAMGFGCELTCFCDLAIATEGSALAITELKVGSGGSYGGTQIFPRVMGEKRAREAIFLAKTFDAHEAEQVGLINKVVPKDKLEEEVESWCSRILEMSPQSIRVAKTSHNFESDLLQPSYRHGLLAWTFLHDSEEWNEGMNAFLEKRKPDFKKFRK